MFSNPDVFSGLTDEELVKRAQNGDTAAESYIFSRYKSSVISTAKYYFSKFSAFCLTGLLDYDDLHQEGLLGLWSAIYSFKDEKNVTFRTYSAKCIANAIKAAVKTATSKKNNPVENIIPLDDIYIPAPISVEASVIDDEDIKELNSFLKTELSDFEYSVLRLFLSEFSYKKISENLKVAEKSVDNAIQRIRGKINRFLNNRRS
ncbi:MAG: sigma-70 family RNA polymerase sigma factor [Ruminococcaceae bacterium]|nr:sigma-70 family RNA polymerase sigma factor [Oscillospiraceae bacterium]